MAKFREQNKLWDVFEEVRLHPKDCLGIKAEIYCKLMLERTCLLSIDFPAKKTIENV